MPEAPWPRDGRSPEQFVHDQEVFMAELDARRSFKPRWCRPVAFLLDLVRRVRRG